jgi:hypothetical protein
MVVSRASLKWEAPAALVTLVMYRAYDNHKDVCGYDIEPFLRTSVLYSSLSRGGFDNFGPRLMYVAW